MRSRVRSAAALSLKTCAVDCGCWIVIRVKMGSFGVLGV